MSFRFVVATALGLSAFGLHAQDPRIRSSLERCIPQSLTNHQAFRSCVNSDWTQMLREETQRAGQQAGEKAGAQGFQKCQANYQPQVADLQKRNSGLEQRFNQCDAELRKATGKPAPDLSVLINDEVKKDRAARRAAGSAAVENFGVTLKTNAKDLEFAYWNGGVMLIRRQGREPSIVVPFPSLARAYPVENNKQLELRIECVADITNCMTLFSRDGGVSGSSAENLPISGTEMQTLVDRAQAAIRAFQ